MKNLTCVLCPMGCSLEVDEKGDGTQSLIVTGNKCPRGKEYAICEIREPKRTVTATMFIKPDDTKKKLTAIHRVPVKTSSPCPRERIPALLEDIYKRQVSLPVKAGDVLIANWNDSKIDVVATRTVN